MKKKYKSEEMRKAEGRKVHASECRKGHPAKFSVMSGKMICVTCNKARKKRMGEIG
jgi:hypothetical protein